MKPTARKTEKIAKRKPAPRPPAAARRSERGADTRADLIDAALTVFGRQGFEGASTREIAQAAKANLAAIVYHFGGKEQLHVAVAEHVAKSIAARVGPTVATISAAEASASPEAARRSLHLLVQTFADVMLGAAEAERWARFIVREQLQPTAAFDVIYGVLGNAISTAIRLMALALGRPETDDEVQLRVLTMMGQVLVFRVAHTLVLRRLNWKQIGDAERTRIKRLVTSQIDAILDGAERP